MKFRGSVIRFSNLERSTLYKHSLISLEMLSHAMVGNEAPLIILSLCDILLAPLLFLQFMLIILLSLEMFNKILFG